MSTVYRLLDVGRQFFDDNGDPYAGGKLFTYTAGSSTKKTAYQDADGTTPHANPIVLDSSGRLPAPVWGTTGAYKFVLAPSTDTDPPASPEWTEDGVRGINDTGAGSVDQWVASGIAPTYVGGTSFTLLGDQTSVFHVGRRLKSANTVGTVYSTITASSYSAPDTTITVVNDASALDSGLSNVSYGLLSATQSSIPTRFAPRAPIVEAGTILPFAGTTAPAGYLNCDGANVSRTTQAALFAAIGTTWGVGDGSTTFGVPDLRRRTAVGSGGTGTGTLGNAVGNTGGAETVAHQHTLSGHTHGATGLTGSFTTGATAGAGGGVWALAGSSQGVTISGATAAPSIDVTNSLSPSVIQPSAVVNYIIKT